MKMLKCGALVAMLGTCGLAQAGPYADDLSKCLVSSTTAADRSDLVRWMFTAAAAHPDLAAMIEVTPAQLDKANSAVGALLMKLLTESCRKQASDAVTLEGPTTFQTSFEVLGRVAGTELFSNTGVANAMAGMEKHLDSKKLAELKR